MADGELGWHKEVNKNRDPVDYEDKWGKANSANYSFYAPPAGLKIAKRENVALCKRTGEMTFEFWLKE